MSGPGAVRTDHLEPASPGCGGESPLLLLKLLESTAERSLAQGHKLIEVGKSPLSLFACLAPQTRGPGCPQPLSNPRDLTNSARES